MKYILILILLALLALIFIAWKAVSLICIPEKRSYEMMREQEIEHGFGESIRRYENEWERRHFRLNIDGFTLRGEVIRNPSCTDNSKVAIVCHGHEVNRYCSIKYADMFYRAGYHVLIYDERYFGKSGGAYSTLGQNEAKDLAEVIAYSRTVFPEQKILVLHGESMGAATALLCLQYEKPTLVIADCPFCESTRLFDEWTRKNLHIPGFLVLPFMEIIAILRYRYHIRKCSPLNAVKQSDVPICFMHGNADGLIDHRHSEKLYSACRNRNSELHLFEGADHASSVVIDPEGYEKILLDFLRKNNAL